MTAEVAVLNRHAVALAADSAVTIRSFDGSKVFNSSNKLFALKHAPVGIMIFGEADFMGIPWEPLLKVYRTHLGDQTRPTIREYATDLINWLKNHRLTNETDRQNDALGGRATQFFARLASQAHREIETEESAAARNNQAFDPHAATRAIVKRIIEIADEALRTNDALDGYQDVVTRRAKLLAEIATMQFKRRSVEILDAEADEFVGLFARAMALAHFPGSTGVVVAGYGEDDMFPGIIAMDLDGVYDGYLRQETREDVIGVDANAMLVPFAQKDVVSTFMEGLNPDLGGVLSNAVERVLGNMSKAVVPRVTGLTPAQVVELEAAFATAASAGVETFDGFLRKFKESTSAPIARVISVMPKEELAELAESLVHLTSTRRRVAMDTETVGGPIDVAVITKGDGFIWLKRKHYFRPELNPQFFTRMLNGRK